MMSYFQQDDADKIINRYQNINKDLSALQMLYIVGNNFITVLNIYLSLFYWEWIPNGFPQSYTKSWKSKYTRFSFFPEGWTVRNISLKGRINLPLEISSLICYFLSIYILFLQTQCQFNYYIWTTTIIWTVLTFLTVLAIQFSSVQAAQSCLTLCDPMNCSMPGLPVNIS